jgi:hypothetical protein
MMSVIASIILAISVLIATLITFTPNARVIMESDFMRSAKNNAYIAGWEWGQLNVRTNNLDNNAARNTLNTDLGYLYQKDGANVQSLSDTIRYNSTADPNNPISITVNN